MLDKKEQRRRINDYMQKCRAEKQLKIRRAEEQIKFLADLSKAEYFDRKRLLKHVIFKFQNILRWKIRNQNASIEMQQRIIIRNTFAKWKQNSVSAWEERNKKAIGFHDQRCLKIAWSKWQQEYRIAQSNKRTADDWFHLRLSERVFLAWYRSALQTKHLIELKQIKADAHFNW